MLKLQYKRVMPYLVGLLTLIMLVLGWIGYSSVNKVADLTEELYEHPLAVSTAVLRIHVNSIIMHRAMKDLVLNNSPVAFNRYRGIVDQAEEKILGDFQLVEERFLGDAETVRSARDSFIAWKPIRNDVMRLVLEGKREEAANITQTTGARQVEEIETKIGLLRDYATVKSQEFLVAAKLVREQTIRFLWLGLCTALILAGIVFRKAVGLESNLCALNGQLDIKVVERTRDLASANDIVTAQNEEIAAMNEELIAQNEELTAQNEEITAMNEEIVSLNQSLSGLNEELEKRVEERTAELSAAHQEVTAQFEELRAIQETLEQEQVLTQALFDSVPGMLYLYDDKGRLVRWNKRHETMTGYSSEEIADMRLLDWYKGDPETCDRINREVMRALREGFASAEADLTTKDGTKLAMFMTAVPLKLEGKTYFAGIGIDVTDRKRTEKLLAANQTSLRTLVETIPDMIWLKNTEGVYLSCNPMFEYFFGAREAEIVGRTDYDFVEKEVADLFREYDKKAMMAGSPSMNEEWVTLAGNGQKVLLETVKTPMFDAGGGVVGVLGIARNITERKQMGEALSESEARYRAVMEQAPETVMICDPDTGELIEANARFTERFGYDLLRDGPLNIFQITEDKPENARIFLDKVKKDHFLPVQRRVVCHKNGSLIQVERSATLIKYRDRSLIVLTIRDVSEEVRREQEIERDAQLATRVQKALLTLAEPSEYLDISAIYQPYSYVGGDMYFTDWRYDGQVLRGFVIDATGHGLGTALHTSAMHVLLREVNELDLPLAEQMRWINHRAGQYFDDGTFAGALGFEVDLQIRQLRWVCAGIPEVWVATKSLHGVVVKPGMYLGMSEDETFETHILNIDVGDAFYFLTDGLAERLGQRPGMPLESYPEMVGFLRTMAQDKTGRDDATAICLQVRSLPQLLTAKEGWPRILRFNGYGDYQRFKGEIAEMLAQVTGLPHSIQEVAVNEALANALECRDGIPRQHKAKVRFNQMGNRLVVRVTSSRMGFAGNAILRRLRANPENMFSFGEDAGMGRGIPIMLSTSHQMTYNSEGTEVLLAWKLADAFKKEGL